MKIVNLDRVYHLKALFYGDSGAGKSVLCASAMACEETRPALVLEASGQPVSYRMYDLPLIVSIETMKDLNAPYHWLASGQPWEMVERNQNHPFFAAIQDYFGGEEGKFKTVILDSASQLQRLSILRVSEMENLLPGEDPKTLDIRGWGGVLSQMTNVADAFYGLDMHVIMTALASHDPIPQLNIVKNHPLLQGQTARELPSKAELVGFLLPIKSLTVQQRNALKERGFDLEGYNVLFTEPGTDFQAKWQGVVNNPGIVVSPTIQKLVAIGRGDSEPQSQ